MSLYDEFEPRRGMGRNTTIAIGVVLLHVAALWALQTGLLRRAVEVIVPAELLSQFVTPPAPVVAPEPPPPTPAPQKTPSKVVKAPAPRPAPTPLPVADAPATPNAPIVAPAAPEPPQPAPVAAAPVAAPAPAPARIELPSSNAAYLQNPAPTYPAISKRMGEQGKVVLRVYISTEGLPEKVEINRSSGFERLDRQAQDTVARWKFVPGKRNGTPEAMWYLVPINFVLD